MRNAKFKIYLVLIITIIAGIVIFNQYGGRSVTVKGTENGNSSKEDYSKIVEDSGVNPITGLECQGYRRRPIAVMLATDSITRPLSGIGAADLIIEMPAVTDIITRIMAVYICEEPSEIGSVRSARHDFIPLAMGLDAIFAHWGGSHYALDKLDAGIMDNIDAMENPYNAYWRKSGIPMPHDGFTSMSRLINAAQKIGYRLENRFEGYSHIQNSKLKIKNSSGKLTIGYPGEFRVYYEYDSETNSYKRWRNGTPEIDKLTNEQVAVQNVVVMRAPSRMIEPPNYNDVDIEGSGEAIVYLNGEEISGAWRKKGRDQSTKLYFLDEKDKEIKFVPGKIWIEIVEPYNEVKWETK